MACFCVKLELLKLLCKTLLYTRCSSNMLHLDVACFNYDSEQTLLISSPNESTVFATVFPGLDAVCLRG